MKLLVKQDYRSNASQYRAGEVIEVSAEFGAWLMRDSTDSFEPVKPARKLTIKNRAYSEPEVEK